MQWLPGQDGRRIQSVAFLGQDRPCIGCKRPATTSQDMLVVKVCAYMYQKTQEKVLTLWTNPAEDNGAFLLPHLMGEVLSLACMPRRALDVTGLNAPSEGPKDLPSSRSGLQQGTAHVQNESMTPSPSWREATQTLGKKAGSHRMNQPTKTPEIVYLSLSLFYASREHLCCSRIHPCSRGVAAKQVTVEQAWHNERKGEPREPNTPRLSSGRASILRKPCF